MRFECGVIHAHTSRIKVFCEKLHASVIKNSLKKNRASSAGKRICPNDKHRHRPNPDPRMELLQ